LSHVAFDSNFYSVPYNLVHELVEVRSLPTTVAIFHKSARVASHLRSHGRGQVVTNPEHRPKSHQAHLEWTPLRMVNWARTVGPNTACLFERILEDKPHPEMGYRGCLGIIRLADVYTPAPMESAAQLALATGACRYQSIKSILKNSTPRPTRRLRRRYRHLHTTTSAEPATSTGRGGKACSNNR
jgi:hypothetical protein